MPIAYWMKIEASRPPEAQTFSINVDNSETQPQGVLDIYSEKKNEKWPS